MAVKKSRQFPGFLIYSQFNDFERGTICQLKVLCKGRQGYLYSQKKYIER